MHDVTGLKQEGMEEARGEIFKVDCASVKMFNAAAECQFQRCVGVCITAHFPVMKVIDFSWLEVNNGDEKAP